ncbi:MAG TPA: DinB family protein [Pyrinomonadaceae bacterium]|nr:DinB family protein [Pyrinomonadaceae bacterium]
MHPRSEEVLNYLDQTRSELRAAVDSVPSQARNTKPADDRWSVAQVLDHLAIAHRLVAATVSKSIAEARATGLGPETATTSVLHTIPAERILDRTRKVQAPERILPRADVDAETAWSGLEQAHAQLRAALLSGDGLALEQVIKPHPVLGPLNMYQWTLFNGSHEARHTLQIRELAEALKSGRGAGAST